MTVLSHRQNRVHIQPASPNIQPASPNASSIGSPVDSSLLADDDTVGAPGDVSTPKSASLSSEVATYVPRRSLRATRGTLPLRFADFDMAN